MKKLLIIGTLAGVVLLALGVAGYAYAKSTDVDVRSYVANTLGAGRGMMGGHGYGQGMPGRSCAGSDENGEHGFLHDYMSTAFAQALGLTPEELEARCQAGDTLWDIAEEQGLTLEQLREMIVTARTNAINQAVEDEVITQLQADFMLERLENMAENGMGFGFGAGNGGCGHNRGGRWNNQP